MDRADCRRVLAGYGRDEDTPAELVIRLDPLDGYVCDGDCPAEADRPAVAARDLAAEILARLPGRRPGLTAEEILASWPGETRPRRATFFAALIKGVEDGRWERAGRGVKGDPQRYYAPDQDAVFEGEPSGQGDGSK